MTVATVPGEIEIVYRAKLSEFGFLAIGKRFVGGVHIAKMRFAANRWNLLRVYHRRLPRGSLPRAIGVPSHGPAVGVATMRLAVFIQIAERIEFWELVRVILIHNMNLYLAEVTADAHVACRREILLLEHQDLVG